MITGARALVDCLLREGIDHAFGIPGTQNLPILDVLRDTPRIRWVLTRHEQAASFMALGFARACGRLAVVSATEGPGITNLATGFGAAYKGFVPLIGVNGKQENWICERDASQDMDQETFFRPITKWAYSIPSASKVQEAVRKAFRVALTEPMGPVHLDGSRDVWLEETESEPLAPAAYRTTTLPDCNAALLDGAADMLAAAERPVFVVGSGVVREEAREAMVDLAELSGIPVAALQYSPDAFPTNHPLALGPMGRSGWRSANQVVPKADLIVAIGARFDVFSTTHKYGIISQGTKIIHHNVVSDPIGVVFPADLGVTGSTLSFIQGLTQRIKKAGRRWSWVDVAGARAEWEAHRAAQVNAEAVPVQVPFVGKVLRKVMPANTLLVVDAGNATKHVRTQFDILEPRTYMYSDDWGSVGFGLATAMGAKLARPDRPVVACCGDMGFMANVGELETAMREKIQVLCVVMNDQGLGNERGFQKELYGGRIFGCDYQNPDFGALARVFGAYGEQVREPAQLEGAIRRAVDSGKPAVVEVVTDQEMLAPVVYKG